MRCGLFFMDLGESTGMKAARAVLGECGIRCIDVRMADDPEYRDRVAQIQALAAAENVRADPE